MSIGNNQSGAAAPHSKTQARIGRGKLRPRFGLRRCSAAFLCPKSATVPTQFEMKGLAQSHDQPRVIRYVVQIVRR
jgi:hypothetical protein